MERFEHGCRNGKVNRFGVHAQNVEIVALLGARRVRTANARGTVGHAG
jgi:hypothetical protein